MPLTGEAIHRAVRVLVPRLPTVRVVGSLVLHLPEVGAPALSAGVLLQALLLGASVLEPHLYDAHV